uniref:Uncharacterized protein n=1 Tax=Glossina austeni TaxID=7395 RepID=A0A1A9VI79_GLOAU
MIEEIWMYNPFSRKVNERQDVKLTHGFLFQFDAKRTKHWSTAGAIKVIARITQKAIESKRWLFGYNDYCAIKTMDQQENLSQEYSKPVRESRCPLVPFFCPLVNTHGHFPMLTRTFREPVGCLVLGNIIIFCLNVIFLQLLLPGQSAIYNKEITAIKVMMTKWERHIEDDRLIGAYEDG